jgi:anti-sigma factor RsiW
MKASMQVAEYQDLVETSWRRPLTDAERRKLKKILATNPERQAPWQEDAALTGLLRRVPSVSVSSNFTARVVQAVQRAPTKPGWRIRIGAFPWFSGGWVPRVALGMAMVCCGVLSFHEYQVMRRAQEAQAIASVSHLASLPSIDWLENFDTIDRMNKVQVADDELLTVLQ